MTGFPSRKRESEGKREKPEREGKRVERNEGREGENEREEERGRGIQFSSSFRAAHARAQEREGGWAESGRGGKVGKKEEKEGRE